MKNNKTAKIAMLLAAVLALMATAYAAYKGHANDADVNAILSVYPTLKNTAVDSCATCHKSGRSSFSIIAVRVNPLPKGTRDFEWEKVRDQFVSGEKLAIFGAMKNQRSK